MNVCSDQCSLKNTKPARTVRVPSTALKLPAEHVKVSSPRREWPEKPPWPGLGGACTGRKVSFLCNVSEVTSYVLLFLACIHSGSKVIVCALARMIKGIVCASACVFTCQPIRNLVDGVNRLKNHEWVTLNNSERRDGKLLDNQNLNLNKGSALRNGSRAPAPPRYPRWHP
jgi:hypothetical protein